MMNLNLHDTATNDICDELSDEALEAVSGGLAGLFPSPRIILSKDYAQIVAGVGDDH